MENLTKQTDITGMQSAGRVLPLWRGDYSDTSFYEQTDIVLYNNSSYIARQDTIGNTPPESSSNANEYWQLVAKGIIDADMSDATVEFTRASTRENIQSGEDGKTLFGKIAKFFADLKTVAFSGKYSDLSGTPGVVSKTANGFVPQLPNETTTTKYLRQDGTWQVPPDTNTQTITSVNGKTGAVTLNATDVKAFPAAGNINKLTNISQITNMGFWAISAIDNTYATSIGIDNNTGDFYALVLSYNGNADKFNFGTIILTSPRINGFHYQIQVWEGTATAVKTINNKNILNTIEQISANTAGGNVAGALALKAAMSDYNTKINTINSNLLPVYTTVDSAPELWNLIPRQPFVILGIRGGTNLFGRNGNYVGMLYIINGVITGIMIDHWTGNLYTAIGSTYGENDDIHFNPVVDMQN